MEITRDNIRIELEHYDEGLNGNYDPDDPEDIALCRFYVLKKDENEEWEQIEDASYCTQISDDTPDEVKRRLMEIIMDEVYEPARNGHRIEKACEQLSWIEPEWLECPMYKYYAEGNFT